MKTSNIAIAKTIKFIALFLSISFVSLLSVQTASADTSGGWVNKKYSIKGGWEIVKNGDQTVIRFDEKFKTKGGPDLKVFLSKQTIADVTGKTATQDAVLISNLTKLKGTQQYVLPADINIDDYTSLLIHCEAYSVLWGGSNI